MNRAADIQVNLAGPIDLAGFRSEVRQLLAQQVPPEAVQWQLEVSADGQYAQAESAQASRPRNVARAATAIVPASFTRLCEFVVLHRDAQRFQLLYRLLWRLVHEPGLRNDPIDADMLQAQHMAHAVRRDIHKLKANLRLQAVRDAQGEELQVACHEPVHHVVEATAPWLAKRTTAPRWVLFTPERSVRCDQGRLLYAGGVPRWALPAAQAPDADWLACYARVFALAGGDRPAAHA
jgi:DNA polymerase